MKKWLAIMGGLALINLTFPALVLAGDCPPELAQAQKTLRKAQQAVNKSKAEGKRAERLQAGARDQAVQAPRGQEVQAPRGQEVQAPRGEEVQPPRGQEVQAPRLEAQAARLAKARALVREADRACKMDNMALSAQKAKEALALLK